MLWWHLYVRLVRHTGCQNRSAVRLLHFWKGKDIPLEASCPHNAVSEDSGILGFDAVLLGDWSTTFWKTAVHSAPHGLRVGSFWGFRNSGFWRCVVGWLVHDVSKDRSAFSPPRSRGRQFLRIQEFLILTLCCWVTGPRRFESSQCIQPPTV
jgi:hypothetical protein